MNDPKVLYLRCPNPGCVTNDGRKGQQKMPVAFIREVEVVLDSGYEERGQRIVYRCPYCQFRFQKP